MDFLVKRRSIRIATVDYNQVGEYFITLCVAQRLALFGRYQNQGVQLNGAGHMIDEQWRALLNRFPSIILDAYVVMPDHFHAIVVIVASCENLSGTTFNTGSTHQAEPQKGPVQSVAPIAPRLGTLVGMFKHHTYQAYLNGIQQHSWQIPNKRLWQRNYFEHIIRNDQDYNDCQAYILSNPYEGWKKYRDQCPTRE